MHDKSIELSDLLDQLVGKYSDRFQAGERPSHREYLSKVAAEARPGLERCLKMIDSGLGQPCEGPQALVPGLHLGRYRLLREVGRGGMALVWLAQDEELKRPIALKILRPGLAMEASHVDRFRREALAIAKLQHEHIVRVFDVGQVATYHYLAMEYIEGPSFASVLEALPKDHGWSGEDLVRATGLPNASWLASREPRDASFECALLRLLVPVAEALGEAHARGLVHRDIKPSNILLRSDGSPVVADFGLAKADGDAALSMTGDPLGTPFYMSPEQAWLSETRVDQRSDIYSFGVMLYEAISGVRPFTAASVLEVFEKIKSSMPASLRGVEPRVSKDTAALVHRAMARRPEDRYDSAAELVADLECGLAGQPTLARRERGSAPMRAWAQLLLICSGYPYEYISARTLLGWPLVHVHVGQRHPGQKNRVAKGWLAVGDIAYGFCSLGGFSAGVFAIGGISMGLLLSLGGLVASALFGAGGVSIAAVAAGGVAVGLVSFGGMSLGYMALGGLARGWYAMGGNIGGQHLVDGTPSGITEEEFWDKLFSLF